MNIYEKLVEVRKSVQYLKKENKGQQYNYVSSSQTLGSIKAAIDEQGLLLIPSVTGKNVREYTVTKEGGKQTTTYFTELDMDFTWVNAEKPEETITCSWYGQGVDIAGEKGVGKAMTYAEKYFFLKFFNIPTDKDDPDSFQKKFEDPEPVKKISVEQEIELRGMFQPGSTYSEEEFLKAASIAKLSDLLETRYKGAINHLKALANNAKSNNK